MNERARRIRSSIWGRLGIVGIAGTQADKALDQTQAQVFRLLWLFLPEPSVARDVRFQHLLVSRFFSEAGQQTLTFGALVSVARGGGSAFEVALIGVAGLLPPAVVGLYGGVVADALPKRLALAFAYLGQALLCFSVPFFFDTSDLAVMFLLLLAVSSLAQVSTPTESSVLPLVANDEELATAASLINFSVVAGQGAATGLFAPVLVKAVGVDTAIYLAGGLLLLSATRVFDLPVGDKDWQKRFPPLRVRARHAVRWLIAHPAVGSMIVLSVMAGIVNTVLITLAPRYVVAVLDTDPTNTAYVFAPGALGVAFALGVAPFAIHRAGERATSIAALFVSAVALFMLGIVEQVGSAVDVVNPLHASTWLGIEMNRDMRTAGLLAVPLSFGVSLTATSVQTYVNRRVPIAYQGRTFAIQSALRSGAAIPPLLTMGLAAAVIVGSVSSTATT